MRSPPAQTIQIKSESQNPKPKDTERSKSQNYDAVTTSAVGEEDPFVACCDAIKL